MITGTLYEQLVNYFRVWNALCTCVEGIFFIEPDSIPKYEDLVKEST